MGVGAAKAAGELKARTEVPEPPEDAQLRNQLGGPVRHGGAREGEDEPVGLERRREPVDRLRALRRRVLAVVGLVEHERARLQGAQGIEAGCHDLVVDDGDVAVGEGPAAVPASIWRLRSGSQRSARAAS